MSFRQKGQKMKITYTFADKSTTTIKISDEYKECIIELDKEEYNSYHKLRRHSVSLNALDPNGKSVSDGTDIVEDYIGSEEVEILKRAMATLLPEQQQLLQRIFYAHEDRNERICRIAEEDGVSEAAIRNRLNKIYARLRKFF